MFIGRHARTFHEDAVAGYGPHDGLPRNEISCHDSFLCLTQKDIDSVQPLPRSIGGPATRKRQLRLEQVLQHDTLYKAYPGLRRTQVVLTCPAYGQDNPVKTHASYYNGGITLNLWANVPLEEVHRSAAHEVQHNVQDIEGFSPGMPTHTAKGIAYYQLKDKVEDWLTRSNSQLLKDKLCALAHAYHNNVFGPDVFPFLSPHMFDMSRRSEEQITRVAQQVYLNDLGERESRQTEERLMLTPAQRNALHPEHLLRFAPPQIAHSYDNTAALAQHRNRAILALPSRIFNTVAQVARRQPVARSGYTP